MPGVEPSAGKQLKTLAIKVNEKENRVHRLITLERG